VLILGQIFVWVVAEEFIEVVEEVKVDELLQQVNAASVDGDDGRV
jgi:hypothetical protein